MYLGLYSSRCTLKNQLTFPSKLTQLTGKRIFITNWFENSLVILSHDRAEETLNKMLSLNSSLLPEARELERFLYSKAQRVELDNKNRFVIDKKLKEYAKLGKEAVFLGIRDRIELWDSELYANYSQIREKQIRETAIDLYNRILEQEKKAHDIV